MAKLGVNIDHVATLRNARGTHYPDPVEAALISEEHGADGITAHLREDRRHIKDEDLFALKRRINTRLNMEMASTDEMVDIALKLSPYMVTLVPERREELTTEGGLDVARLVEPLTIATSKLQDAGILVSLFIAPDPVQVAASIQTGAKIVEFHTGRYCENWEEKGLESPDCQRDLNALFTSSIHCLEHGIEVNAGHGLHYKNVKPVLEMPGLNELNIGHSIVARAIDTGIGPAVREMKNLIAIPVQTVATVVE